MLRTDGQTDEQTDILPRHSPGYAYASRDKNVKICGNCYRASLKEKMWLMLNILRKE